MAYPLKICPATFVFKVVIGNVTAAKCSPSLGFRHFVVATGGFPRARIKFRSTATGASLTVKIGYNATTTPMGVWVKQF